MQRLFEDEGLPKDVLIQGSFSENCQINLSEMSKIALENGRLKLLVKQQGGKKIIDNCNISISAISGNIKIFVGNDDANIIFGEHSSGHYEIRLWRNSKVIIGSNTTSNGVKIVCDNSEFITGKDCMLSDGILIQSADQHGLVDLKTGNIFNNKYRKVMIGDHVWLGRFCTLMPDVEIGDGSIIGTSAVVTSNVDKESIAVGVPSKIIKSDVTWSRLPNTLDYMSKEYIALFNANKIISEYGLGSKAYDLIKNAISVGINCEFGFFQRILGMEDSHLFKWAVTPLDSIVDFMEQDYQNLYDFNNLIPRQGKMVIDTKYGFSFHSKMASIKEDDLYVFTDTIDKRQTIHKGEKEKFNYLVQKFKNSIKEGGKIFVLKSIHIIDWEQVQKLFMLLNKNSKNINMILVLECGLESNNTPTLDPLKDNQYIFRGKISRFAPLSKAGDLVIEDWIHIFNNLSNKE